HATPYEGVKWTGKVDVGPGAGIALRFKDAKV
ncbi:MAG: hypothetical protein RLZZ563_1609, partial [Pseudomonadota bacterium]